MNWQTENGVVHIPWYRESIAPTNGRWDIVGICGIGFSGTASIAVPTCPNCLKQRARL